MWTKWTVLAGLVCLFTTCTEDVHFDPQNNGYLVVDGFITDRPGPHSIVLKKSGTFLDQTDGGTEELVTGAQVTITDDLGEEIMLTETNGAYLTPENFQGVAGRSYSLCITVDETTKYQSKPELLRSSSPIDSLYYKFSIVDVLNNSNGIDQEFRVEFLVDFEFPSEEEYYKWEWLSTYILETFCITTPETLICDRSVWLSDPPPTYCYVTQWSNGRSNSYLNMMSSQESTSRKLTGHSIQLLDPTIEFVHKYSMLVNQYSLSKEAFDYWTLVEGQLNNTGSIFDAAPVQIRGNIFNVDNSQEVVLGYFGAQGITSKRIFIEADDIGIGPDQLFICNPDLGGTIPHWCSDCRLLTGSSGNKPDFWED